MRRSHRYHYETLATYEIEVAITRNSSIRYKCVEIVTIAHFKLFTSFTSIVSIWTGERRSRIVDNRHGFVVKMDSSKNELIRAFSRSYEASVLIAHIKYRDKNRKTCQNYV